MFNIKVPNGKEAGFNFNRFLYEINSDGSQRRGAKMTLVVECDGRPIFRNSWNEKISARGVDVIIPEGEHVMKLDFTTSHRRYNFAGSINDLSLHVHEYGDTRRVCAVRRHYYAVRTGARVPCGGGPSGHAVSGRCPEACRRKCQC